LQGHTYAFYSLATDLAGNREGIPTVADATTSVNLTNTPPQLLSATVVLNEGDTLRYTNVVADPDLPLQNLTFSLEGTAPVSASLNPTTGVLTWPTTEANGPSTNRFALRVIDNGYPPYGATGLITVVVTEVNQAPSLQLLTDRVISEGKRFTFNALATDPDLPANALTFSLLGAPAGAVVDSSTGLFSWQPSETQGGRTNRFRVVIRDNGQPSLSSTQQITLIVRDTLGDFELAIGDVTLVTGTSDSVPVSLTSGMELSRLDVRLGITPGFLTNLALVSPSSEISSLSLLAVSSSQVELSYVFDSSRYQGGSRILSEFGFVALPGTNSGIVHLRVLDLEGRRVDGEAVTKAGAQNGRVFVLGRAPLLDACAATNGSVDVTVHGLVGRNYLVDSSSILSPESWIEAWNWMQTNLVQTQSNLSPTNRFLLWRAREP
jgi:hypothetical protein